MEISFGESFGNFTGEDRSGQETPAFIVRQDSNMEKETPERRKTFESYLWDEKKLTIAEWKRLDEKPAFKGSSLRNIKTVFQNILKRQISKSNRDIAMGRADKNNESSRGIENTDTKRPERVKFKIKSDKKGDAGSTKNLRPKQSEYKLAEFRVITSSRNIFNSRSKERLSKAKSKTTAYLGHLGIFNKELKKSKTSNLIDFDLEELGIEEINISNIEPEKPKMPYSKDKGSDRNSSISSKLSKKFASLTRNSPVRPRETSRKIMSDRTCFRASERTPSRIRHKDNINLINFD